MTWNYGMYFQLSKNGSHEWCKTQESFWTMTILSWTQPWGLGYFSTWGCHHHASLQYYQGYTNARLSSFSVLHLSELMTEGTLLAVGDVGEGSCCFSKTSFTSSCTKPQTVAFLVTPPQLHRTQDSGVQKRCDHEALPSPRPALLWWCWLHLQQCPSLPGSLPPASPDLTSGWGSPDSDTLGWGRMTRRNCTKNISKYCSSESRTSYDAEQQNQKQINHM